MEGLNKIKEKISDMAQISLDMWRVTHRTFMEHDEDLIPGILDNENKLNEMEKELTGELVSLARSAPSPRDKEKALIYVDVVGDFELIGDYCKDILERVQIKIEEKLLFSEDAVREYEVLYKKTEDAIDEIATALKKDSPALIREVLKKDEHIDTLIDGYRRSHNQRMVAGVCTPIGCNMFLNILDFTAAVYYHAKKIAKNLSKIK